MKWQGELEGKVSVVKIDIDKNPNVPTKYGVRGIPTLMVFKEGENLDQVVGNQSKENIHALVGKHL